MKTLFQIGSTEREGEDAVLLLEIGADHYCHAFLDRGTRTITGLKYITGEAFEIERRIGELLAETRSASFSGVWVSAAFPPFLLVPATFQEHGAAFLQEIYQEPGQEVFQDHINEWQVSNAYSIPEGIIKAVTAMYPNARFLHACTPALRIYNGFSAEEQVSVHFTTQHFRVIVKKGGGLVLVQTYVYKTPLDVVYYLLKICSEIGIDQAEVYIILSGLVDADSALYKELHHYFLNLHFAHGPEIGVPENDHPPHFFTSLYNLAACVS